jgi:hypothetical protein
MLNFGYLPNEKDKTQQINTINLIKNDLKKKGLSCGDDFWKGLDK